MIHPKSLCVTLKLHTPVELQPRTFFAEEAGYFPTAGGTEFETLAKKKYLPTLRQVQTLLQSNPNIHLSLAFSGSFLDHCQGAGSTGEEVLSVIRKIVATGQVEIIAENHYHTLSFLFSKEEFGAQIRKHVQTLQKLFDVTPQFFRNVGLVSNNELAEFIRQIGFRGMLVKQQTDKSPNFLHTTKQVHIHPEEERIAKNYAHSSAENALLALPKNESLSEDLNHNFFEEDWEQGPLNAEKFSEWLLQTPGEVVHLALNTEPLTTRNREGETLLSLLAGLQREGLTFRTPSQVAEAHTPAAHYDAPEYRSWGHFDLHTWLQNDIQHSALEGLSELERLLYPYKDSSETAVQKIMEDFRHLQASNHMYAMGTHTFEEGDTHRFLHPGKEEHSPYESYISFMNTLQDIKNRLQKLLGEVCAETTPNYAVTTH